MKRIYGNIAILFLTLAFLAACTNMLDSPQIKGEAETGTVYIAIDGNSAGKRAAARTLAPNPVDFTQYWVSFSGPEPQADVEITGGGAWVNLSPGEWTITVTAFTSYNEAGRGSAVVTVLSGQTVTADITITPLTGGGRNGYFTCTVTIPSVDSAALILTNMTTNMAAPGTPINLKDAADSSGGIAAAGQNLDAGYYLMNIRLEKNGTYAGKTEVVHVYDGLTTTGEYVFTDNDFTAIVETLADGVWQDADMTASGSEYYRFPVTQGETYAVYWNDSYSGGDTKTLDVKVSAYYENTGIPIFSGVDSGYHTPQAFTAASSDNVIIRVEPYYSGTTGTYAVMYREIMPLTVDTAAPGTITAGGVRLYRFPVNANTVYALSWEDSGDQDWGSGYTGDITVMAYETSIGPNFLFYTADSGYTTPRTVNYSYYTTIYLKVEGVSAGTYSILFSEVPSFIPVTNISGVPSTATVGTPLTLSGTVSPGNATNQNITWIVTNAGSTGAAVIGNTLTATAAGTAIVRARIANGLAASSHYTQDFTITVTHLPGTLSITIGFNLDAITITGSNGTNLIRQTTGTPSSLEFSAEGYANVVWYVDGNTSAPVSGDVLTINAANYTTKLHSVTFTGYKNGTPYAQIIPFTVVY